MPSALVLYFDESSEISIIRLWEALESEGISLDYSTDIRPHITLGIYDELFCQSCSKELAELEKQANDLSITFSHFGIFHEPEVVLFLAPTPTTELLEFHNRIHKNLADFSKTPWEFYQPGKWVPHCTLALGIQPDQFNKAIKVSTQLQLPMTVNTSEIGVVEFHPMNGVFK